VTPESIMGNLYVKDIEILLGYPSGKTIEETVTIFSDDLEYKGIG
jgi:hypothetical protein